MEPLQILEHEGRLSLTLECGNTAVDDIISELGHEPNGYFWEGVAQLLVETEAPDLEGTFEPDPEAGMFCAYGEDRDALERLGGLLASVANDAARLRGIVALAAARGFTFDD